MGSNVKSADARALNRLLRQQGNPRFGAPPPPTDYYGQIEVEKLNDPKYNEQAEIDHEQDVIRQLAEAKKKKEQDEINHELEVIRKLKEDKSSVAAWAADRADMAWKINTWIKKHPDSEWNEQLKQYAPVMSADDMSRAPAAQAYRVGKYTDQDLKNDAETFYLERTGKQRTIGDKIKYWFRGASGTIEEGSNYTKGVLYGLEQTAENYWANWNIDDPAKKKDTSLYNNVYQNLDQNMEHYKDENLVVALGEITWDTLWNRGKEGGKKLGNMLGDAGDKAKDLFWLEFLKPFGGVPLWADVIMILGGIGLGAYSIYEGMQFIAIPSLILAGIGGFCLYAYYYVKDHDPTKDPETKEPNDPNAHQKSKHD